MSKKNLKRTWLDHPPKGRVQVYYNLHKKCLSIRYKGKVIEHAREVTLTDAKFHVQPAGRARVLREKKKNVHAYIKGMPAPPNATVSLTKLGELTYNPYKYKTFVWKETEEPIQSAEWVSLDCEHLAFEDRKAIVWAWKKNY